MQILLNGLISGISIGLFATAFALIYWPTRIFALAMGALFALAPFLVAAARGFGFSLGSAIALSLLLGAVLSIACELFNHRWLEKRRASHTAHLVSSLGIYMVLVEIISLLWGNSPLVLRASNDPTILQSPVIITESQVVASGASLALLSILLPTLYRTRVGLKLRAMAENQEQLALWGHNVEGLRAIAFASAGLIVSAAGLIRSLNRSFDPNSGLQELLLAVVAMIVGGRRTWFSPLIGGICLGVLRSEVSWVLSANWQDAATYLSLAVVIFFRPNGLFEAASRADIKT